MEREDGGTLGSATPGRPASGPSGARKAGPRFDGAALTRFALWYLERWSASRLMVERALKRRCGKAVREGLMEPEAAAQAVEATLAALAAQGLLRDDLYADARVARLARRGRPRARIAADLAARGIEREMVAASLERAEVDDTAAAERYARRRRLGRYRAENRAEHRSRDLAALARAGFSSAAAHAVLDPAEVDAD
jgi:regulatory protein